MRKIFRRVYKRYLSPIIQFRPGNIPRYFQYFQQLYRYRKLGGTPSVLWPILGENTLTTDIDPHYFWQSIWTARHIVDRQPKEHVDIGSQIDLIGFLSTITHVTFVDLRPLTITVPNLQIIRGSILSLPFPDSSVLSLSCLHVAEHIGLGRYGDPLDPRGTEKACTELARVLAPNGYLYFSLPIGHERTEFNAHRIHAPATILRHFSNLRLVEFSAIDDTGRYVAHTDITTFDSSRYACGLFLFTKDEKKS